MDSIGRRANSAEIDAIVEIVAAAPGRLVAVEVGDRRQVQDLVLRLESLYGYGFDSDHGADVRLALGSASSTLDRALEQFAAVLQLTYGSARTLWKFSEAIGERSSGDRTCVVVADAVELVADEDEVIWRALIQELVGRPRCLGGGWDTLVLVDDHDSWAGSRFGSAANAERVAATGLSDAEESSMADDLELRYAAE